MRTGPKEPILMHAMLALAKGVAEASTCRRASVGCVLTTPDLSRIIGYGFNGVPKGYPNDGCTGTDVPGSCADICAHAEPNAIGKSEPGDKVAFITCPPCRNCAKALINADVIAVVYTSGHRPVLDGPELLDSLDIPHGSVEEVFAALYGHELEPDLSTPEGWQQAKAGLSKFD